jgi:hypothetical protein
MPASACFASRAGGRWFKAAAFLSGRTAIPDSIKLSYGHLVMPTVQLLGTVAADLQADGGFKEDFRFNFRLLKVY